MTHIVYFTHAADVLRGEPLRPVGLIVDGGPLAVPELSGLLDAHCQSLCSREQALPEVLAQIHLAQSGQTDTVVFRSPATAEPNRRLQQSLTHGGIPWKTISATARFPLFIPLDGRAVCIVGGGRVAARRVAALLPFGAEITVVSPELSPPLRDLLPRIRWRQERYRGLEGRPALVVAATDHRETNRQVGADARGAAIPVSVADCREESTFWFPAIIREGNLVAGLVSTDGDHKAVKQAADRARTALKGEGE